MLSLSKALMLQVLIAIDQLVNALLGGLADETLSARAHRMRAKGHKWWGWTAGFIDRLFFWQQDHCLDAYLAEVRRRQLPNHYNQPAQAGFFTPGGN